MKKLLLFLLMLISAFSCTKKDELAEIKKPDKVSPRGYYVGPYSLDWEHDTYIDWKGTQVYLPWCSGARGSIPLEIKNDRNSVDGWTLLYNNFPDASADPVFMLYNKFKGIVRVFMYVTNTTYTASSFTWGFGAQTLNCNTATFNFTRVIPEPLSTNYSNPNVYNANYSSDPNIIPNGVTPNAWYYNEFEMMYDPNIVNLNHDNIELCVKCFCTDKKYVKLTGTITGSIIGTFSMPSSGSSSGIFSDLVNGFDVSKLGTINFPTLAESKKFLIDYTAKQSNSYLKTLFNQGLTALNSSLLTSNPVIKALTNGLFSTSASTPGKINCSLKAQTTTEGTITTITAGPSVSFLFPGTATTNKGGLLPNYTLPLGVFYIESKPTINWYQNSVVVNPRDRLNRYYEIYNRLKINPIVNVMINPAVSSLCSNIDIKTQIVYYESVGMDGNTNIDGVLIDSYNSKKRYICNDLVLHEAYNSRNIKGITTSQCMVRVTVSLTPIGQVDPIVLVKEFTPTLVEVSTPF